MKLEARLSLIRVEAKQLAVYYERVAGAGCINKIKALDLDRYASSRGGR